MRKTACALVITAFALLGCHTITEELPTQPTKTKPSSALLTIPIPAAIPGATPTPKPTPVPTPVPTPTPEPVPTPTPAPTGAPPGTYGTCNAPLPPLPLHEFKVKLHIHGANRDILDSTPIVGPDGAYCKAVGFTDGRLFCAIRPEGAPDRRACEEYAVGLAEDTHRPGPTWFRNGELCNGKDCENHEDNQYLLYANVSGRYEACSKDGVCGAVDISR